MSNILSLNNVSRSYLVRETLINVFSGIDIDIKKGEKVAIIGPSGSVAFVHCNVLHGSANNVSPWSRSIIYMNYNAVSNACTEATRPWYQNNRDFSPLKSLESDCIKSL